ncbi:IS110 family transposase [Pseudoalteromonas rubra]|uniref:IS110 family transposase n=1 Tax=Pseudoalteromonas rubra TaxID=43658 RepID=A0A4Q7EN75_9GAMM|nr:IS110 family transposase [Pseudoalteromonas rubra]RZM84904.1 IS110 family transposase [Pseudoalteromonas rubra]
MKVCLIGIDLAKNTLQVCGVNQAGKPIFNKALKRNKLLPFLLNYPDAIVAMEACSGSNYWGRELEKLGIKVRLIPPIHVKPFVKGNKNDRNDAFAITEAAVRPSMYFVKPRSLEQTESSMLHKVRSRWVSQKTRLTNQLRGLLNEYGIVIAPGDKALKQTLPEILEDGENNLSSGIRHLIDNIRQEWLEMEARLSEVDSLMRSQVKSDEDCRRLMKIKGVSTITATAIKAFAGDGKHFKNGRHFSSNLGLVPREHSSGGKQKLSGITKRGNQYIRRLLIQGAWSVLRYAKQSDDDLSNWAEKVMERRGKHKAVVAVANKLARIIWSMLVNKTEYKKT